jgi:hypothetical protein
MAHSDRPINSSRAGRQVGSIRVAVAQTGINIEFGLRTDSRGKARRSAPVDWHNYCERSVRLLESWPTGHR